MGTNSRINNEQPPSEIFKRIHCRVLVIQATIISDEIIVQINSFPDTFDKMHTKAFKSIHYIKECGP